MESHPKTGYFFFNKKGETLSHSAVEHMYSRLCDRIGLKDTRIHDLRHTFCMHRAMVVKSFRQLQTEMGHSSAASIQKYLDEAQRFDIRESIFYTKSTDFSVLENGQKRPQKRPINPKNALYSKSVK